MTRGLTSRAWTPQPPAGLPKPRIRRHHRLPSRHFHSAREQPAEMTTATRSRTSTPRSETCCGSCACWVWEAGGSGRSLFGLIARWHAAVAGTDPQRLGRVDRQRETAQGTALLHRMPKGTLETRVSLAEGSSVPLRCALSVEGTCWQNRRGLQRGRATAGSGGA